MIRRVEALEEAVRALEAQPASPNAPSALHEAKPAYRSEGKKSAGGEGVTVPAKILRTSDLTPKELLVELAEDREDIQIMRAAETEYRAGDAVLFEELVTEILDETE
ncbi:MAG: hypothetical protein GXP37_10915 [Chloroflexi bacterium]|nr:hypothetical protein [Chloroflexota bacterium]